MWHNYYILYIYIYISRTCDPIISHQGGIYFNYLLTFKTFESFCIRTIIFFFFFLLHQISKTIYMIINSFKLISHEKLSKVLILCVFWIKWCRKENIITFIFNLSLWIIFFFFFLVIFYLFNFFPLQKCNIVVNIQIRPQDFLLKFW